MKRIVVLALLLLAAASVYALGSPETNDVPEEYEIADTWYDGAPIIEDAEGTEYYLASESEAYRIYEGKPRNYNDRKGKQYMYCHDAVADVYIPMRGEDGDLEKQLKRKDTEERIPYMLDNVFIIPAAVDTIAPETMTSYYSEIIVRDGNETFAVLDDGLYDKTTKTLVRTPRLSFNDEFEIPEGITGIGPYAINGADSNGKSPLITIPSSVTHIDPDAFRDCTGCRLSFSEVSPDADFTIDGGIVYDRDRTMIIYAIPVGNVYFGSSGIALPDTLLSIPDDFAEGVGRTFSVTIPDSVRHIGDMAFAGEHHETNYTLGSRTWTDSKTKRITICGDLPEDLESIGVGAFEYAVFDDGTITIPAAISRIPNAAFLGIIGVDSIVIPSAVKSIGYGAFRESSIRNVVISDGVESIEDNAFRDMPKLGSINIPSSVASIGEDILAGSVEAEIVIDESCPVYDEIKEQYGEQIKETVDWLQ